jgi:hypothetical protein
MGRGEIVDCGADLRPGVLEHGAVTSKIVIPAHEDHIFWIANHMTEGERMECAAMGLGPYRALHEALDKSVSAWTGMVMPDARPVVMFGVVPLGGLLSGTGEPWFSSTDELRRHRIYFMKRNKEFLEKIRKIFPHLAGYVDVRHTQAHRWLKWLGFSVGPQTCPLGPLHMPFYRFEMGG